MKKEIEALLQHPIFEGFNDKNGILICGPEFGGSSKEEYELPREGDNSTKISARSFSDIKYRFQTNVCKWFDLWGHSLQGENHNIVTNLDRCIVHLNWSPTQNPKICYKRCETEEAISHFISCVGELKPNLIVFFGIELFDILQKSYVIERFKTEAGMGDIVSPKSIKQKPTTSTKRKGFRVGFQSFEHGEIAAFPHASGCRVSHQYIESFKPEMSERILKIKQQKGIVD